MKYDIAIIGGAGPEAGSLFFNKIIRWYQREKGAWEDADFPAIQLLSIPFEDMLSAEKKPKALEDQIEKLAAEISAKHVIIACNTLHCFCKPELFTQGWLHLIETTANVVRDKKPLVLCTTTSREQGLHKNYFDCSYPSGKNQVLVDKIIEDVLRGHHTDESSKEIARIIDEEVTGEQYALLGCTELSLLINDFPISNKNIFDPCDIAVKKLCNLLISN